MTTIQETTLMLVCLSLIGIYLVELRRFKRTTAKLRDQVSVAKAELRRAHGRLSDNRQAHHREIRKLMNRLKDAEAQNEMNVTTIRSLQDADAFAAIMKSADFLYDEAEPIDLIDRRSESDRAGLDNVPVPFLPSEDTPLPLYWGD